MATLDKTKKSNRLLASRRYTHETLTAAQEAFTDVLDLGASEIYTQANSIPSSGLPYSGSSQQANTYTTPKGDSIMKYWYRQQLTKSNTNNEVWFFLNPTGSNSGIGAQLIDSNQQTSFISPKYSIAGLATSTTEDTTPGYLATLLKSTSLNSGSLDGDDVVSTNNYTFDYKTGVVQFTDSSVDPTDSDYLYMTVYQYVGTTLATGLELTGNVSSSYTSTGSFGRIEVSANTLSIGGTEINKTVADNITSLDTPLSSTSVPTFAGLTIDGNISASGDVIAQNYIVKSSVTEVTTSFSSGSTIFGDTSDDIHQFTGSVKFDSTLFDIYDASDELMFKVQNKMAILGTITGAPPSAIAGGIYYSGSDAWYLGYETSPT